MTKRRQGFFLRHWWLINGSFDIRPQPVGHSSFWLFGPRLQDVAAVGRGLELGRLRLVGRSVAQFQLVAGQLVDAVTLLALERPIGELEDDRLRAGRLVER